MGCRPPPHELRLKVVRLWEVYLCNCEGGPGSMSADHSPPPTADGRARGCGRGDDTSRVLSAAIFVDFGFVELRRGPPQRVRGIIVHLARLWPGT